MTVAILKGMAKNGNDYGNDDGDDEMKDDYDIAANDYGSGGAMKEERQDNEEKEYVNDKQ